MDDINPTTNVFAQLLHAPSPVYRPVRSDRTSGVAGVRLKTQRGLQYWMAEWYPQPSRPQRKLFSVLKYGNTGALKLALAERRRRVPEAT